MKPQHISGYSGEHIVYFEQVLVTLLQKLGDWKSEVYLIGGLAPRYLYPEADHAGTADIDLVVTLSLLTAPGVYTILYETLRALGFEWIKSQGEYVHWRWRKMATSTVTVIIDLLCDTEDARTGFSVAHSGQDRLAACNVFGANLVQQDYVECLLTPGPPSEAEEVCETIRVAGLATLLVLKSQALASRKEEKDAYDIVFCLREEGPAGAAAKFHALKAQQEDPYLFEEAEEILRTEFASEEGKEGYLKRGPLDYARFVASGNREQDIRNQREASGVFEAFLDSLVSLTKST